MYGLVNKAIGELVVGGFGKANWEAIKARAGVDEDVFISNQGYPDELTYQLVGAAAEVLKLTAEQVLVAFGEHWVLHTSMRNYGPMMKSGGKTLREFLINLPNFHTRVAMIYPKLAPPRFECTEVTETSLHLHYMTHRPGLTAFVSGLLQGLGKLYETPCTSTVIARKDQGEDHDIFAVQWVQPETS
ncbi:MAG: heme NO-binding domain-containing protein [Akkermansiaceae bacterium]|nr:heme NO-binding domain-containing protein [Akkermansiaceae bacterium]